MQLVGFALALVPEHGKSFNKYQYNKLQEKPFYTKNGKTTDIVLTSLLSFVSSKGVVFQDQCQFGRHMNDGRIYNVQGMI